MIHYLAIVETRSGIFVFGDAADKITTHESFFWGEYLLYGDREFTVYSMPRVDVLHWRFKVARPKGHCSLNIATTNNGVETWSEKVEWVCGVCGVCD